jgi:hypothetical protein
MNIVEKLLETHIFVYFDKEHFNLYDFISNYYKNKNLLGNYFNLQNVKYNKWGNYELFDKGDFSGKFNIIFTLYLSNISSIEVINLFHTRLRTFTNMYEISILDNNDSKNMFRNKNIKLNIFCKFNEYNLTQFINYYSLNYESIPDDILKQFITSSFQFKQIMENIPDKDINIINQRNEKSIVITVKISTQDYHEQLSVHSDVLGDIGFTYVSVPNNEYGLKIGNYNFFKFIY